MSRASSPFAPITRLSLTETVYHRLLGSILEGELALGERLNLERLSAEFGVSRTPLREALLRLEREGLVQVRRNSISAVASWDSADLQFRARVLGGIARSAALDPTRALPSLAAAEPGDPEAFVDVCVSFTEPLGFAVARRVVTEMVLPLRLFSRPSVRRAHDVDARPEGVERAVALLLEAVDEGERKSIATALDDLTDAFVASLHAGSE